MAFELSLSGFANWITRPFTNPIGWILIIALGIYVYLRIKGKIRFKRDQQGPGGPGTTRADYYIK